jgi:hypothetical protein
MVLENLGRKLDKALRRIRRLPKIDKYAIIALTFFRKFYRM